MQRHIAHEEKRRVYVAIEPHGPFGLARWSAKGKFDTVDFDGAVDNAISS